MKNLKFKYLFAKNFLCFGNEGIEINFNNYGNIVLITGENQDVEEDGVYGKNGLGKTSIICSVVYTLFGKTTKGMSHKEVINNINKKDLRTEVRWDKYRVVRTRKPDSLSFYESETDEWDEEGKYKELTLGGMPETQKEIENKLGISYQSFINTVVFTDDMSNSFLSCDTPTKREIVENLLSLDKYREYSKNAKELKKECENKIKEISKDYERIIADFENKQKLVFKIIQQENDWRNSKLNELNKLKIRINEKNKQLEETDAGNALKIYENAQNNIKILSNELIDLEEKEKLRKPVYEMAKSKAENVQKSRNDILILIQNIKNDINFSKNEIKKQENIVNSYEMKKGTKCSACLGTVKEENYKSVVLYAKNFIESENSKIVNNNLILDKNNQELLKIDEQYKKLTEAVNFAEQKTRESSIRCNSIRNEISKLNKIEKPEISLNIKLIQEQINELQRQIEDKFIEYNGLSPYDNILNSTKNDVETKKNECEEIKVLLKNKEEELPYYEFWVDAFGDNGIRKFIIDGILPALNSNLANWLELLVDGKFKISLDNKLEETIERNPPDGDPFVYHGLSKGERQKINLAMIQSFAYITLLNSGINPSLIFLDEVATNVDSIGVLGIYNMITEISKTKQVFITTHDKELLDLLHGCETIQLIKKNNFTIIN